jgi:hypothetical protein
MSEKRGRGQPKFEPTQDQRSQVKMMKALGIPEDRICKTMDGRRDRLRAASDFRRKARTSWRETQARDLEGRSISNTAAGGDLYTRLFLRLIACAANCTAKVS